MKCLKQADLACLKLLRLGQEDKMSEDLRSIYLSTQVTRTGLGTPKDRKKGWAMPILSSPRWAAATGQPESSLAASLMRPPSATSPNCCFQFTTRSTSSCWLPTPKQLPSTVVSKGAQLMGYCKSFFERIFTVSPNNEWPRRLAIWPASCSKRAQRFAISWRIFKKLFSGNLTGRTKADHRLKALGSICATQRAQFGKIEYLKVILVYHLSVNLKSRFSN